MNRKPLAGISEARQVLGVRRGTLRQWTEECGIKVFITLRGYRSDSKEEFEELLVSQKNLLGVKDLLGKLDKTAETHSEIRAPISRIISEMLRKKEFIRTRRVSNDTTDGISHGFGFDLAC